MVSATTFTLVGVINKFLTVLLAVFFLDKHASGIGIIAVCFCLLAGTLYQQADKRENVSKNEASSRSDQLDEGVIPLLENTEKLNK